MTTWSFKRCVAIIALVTLAACDEGGDVLAGLNPPTGTKAPLTQALMMRGAVTLVPPQGFCIDPKTLNQSFALMARCDVMGADTGSAGAPLGLVTISFARVAPDTTLPSATDITAAAGLGAPQSLRRRDDQVIFRTNGPPPSTDLDTHHWRAVARVGAFLMGAALFGPEGRRAVSSEGAEVLEDLIRRTTAKTAG